MENFSLLRLKCSEKHTALHEANTGHVLVVCALYYHPFSTDSYLKVSVLKIIFEKTLIEVGSPHLYASFGTFCVQIGQLFAAQ